MKKSDLENGMIVECRNGKKFMVIKDFTLKTERWGGIDIMLGNNGFINFNSYNNDLSVKSGNIDWNIDKVYCRKYLLDMELKLLWERKEKPKIKLTDDERKLLEVAYNQGYRWIARDRGLDGVVAYKYKPEKSPNDYWDDSRDDCKGLFKDMFEFIKWKDEEPYSIEELLKGGK